MMRLWMCVQVNLHGETVDVCAGKTVVRLWMRVQAGKAMVSLWMHVQAGKSTVRVYMRVYVYACVCRCVCILFGLRPRL